MDQTAPEALTFTLATRALAELKGLAPALGDRLRLELVGDEPGPVPADPAERLCALLVVAGGGEEIPPAVLAATREHLGRGRYLLAVSSRRASPSAVAPSASDAAAGPDAKVAAESTFREFLDGWRFERIFRVAPELAGCGRAALDLRLPSDETLIPGVSHTVGLLLREFGFPQDDWMSTIPLVLDEVLTNAMRHGNGGLREKAVLVRIAVDAAALELTVTDEGSGFRREGVADPRSADRLWRAGGRGLFLIESLMDHVEYREAGRTVHLV